MQTFGASQFIYENPSAMGQMILQKSLDLSVVAPVIEETIAQDAAEEYLTQEVSLLLCAGAGIFIPLARPIWQFAIQLSLAQSATSVMMATLDIDAIRGTVLPLNDEQIESLQERITAIVIAYKNNQQAAFPSALRVPIPPAKVDKITAKVTATSYLHTILGTNFIAGSAAFIPTGRPVWLFDIRHLKSKQDVGVLSINALTGAFLPLTDEQIMEIQERSSHVATTSPS